MKSKKQHVEEWLPVLPKFNDDQLRRLYILMEDYARDYHKRMVGELRLGGATVSFDDEINAELEQRSIVQYNDDDGEPHWDEDKLHWARAMFREGAHWANLNNLK